VARLSQLWNLWAPENAPYLYHREKVYSDVDAYAPDHAKFPLFKHGHRIVEELLEGETLFIPTGWWHTVDSMDTPTVSLSATSWVRASRESAHEPARWWQAEAGCSHARRSGIRCAPRCNSYRGVLLACSLSVGSVSLVHYRVCEEKEPTRAPPTLRSRRVLGFDWRVWVCACVCVCGLLAVQLSAFMRFESRLRSKWPQKSAHPVQGPKGPALPGEQTPKDFDVHDWFVSLAQSHGLKPQLPATTLDWGALDDAKDGEEMRKVIDRYSTDTGDRGETIVFYLLNPQCSKIQFDWQVRVWPLRLHARHPTRASLTGRRCWQAWMIENLGLKNSCSSLLQVMSRDGDDTTQRSIADTVKECSALGAELWSTRMVAGQEGPHGHIMKRIHDGQAKIHGSAAR
jgi:hypothetical protein